MVRARTGPTGVFRRPRAPAAGSAARLAVAAAACLALAPVAAAYEREVTDLAGRLVLGLGDTGLTAVAVVDFTDLRGEPTELGRFLAEELSNALVPAVREGSKPATLRVIDRLRLTRILDELELAASGLLDPAQVRRVGEIAGVDGLVTGSLVAFAERLRLNLKVLDVRSGEILLTDGVELPRTPTLADLEARPLSVRLSPSAGAPIEVRLDGPPHQTVQLRDLEVALQGCVRVEGAVHCLFTVSDPAGERTVYLYGGTRAVLASGKAVPASRLHLGGETASGARSRVGARLVQGIAVQGGVVLEGIPSDVDLLQQLRLTLHGADARFTQVPIRRP